MVKQEISPYISIVMLVLFILMTQVFLTFFSVETSGAESVYTSDSLRYTVQASDVRFAVEVNDIRKERDKEDIYKVSFVDLNNKRVRIDKEMTFTEFDEIVGEGNNTVSGKAYELLYYAAKNDSTGGIHSLKVKRYSFFGEDYYTDDEICTYAEQVANYFNLYLLGGTPRLDSQEIAKSWGSTEVVYRTTTLTEDDVVKLVPIPDVGSEINNVSFGDEHEVIEYRLF